MGVVAEGLETAVGGTLAAAGASESVSAVDSERVAVGG